MIVLREAELFQLPLRLRMPFRYGIATLTALPHAVLRATWEVDGRTAVGYAADNLPPKWFTKDAARAPDEEIAELWSVIRRAIALARPLRAATAFAFWRELDAAQSAAAAVAGWPPLLSNFGTSMVERTLIDAVCRARGVTLAVALRENALGIDLGAVARELAGSVPAAWLGAPADHVFARHTVGLSDPLDDTDLADRDRVNDGLPQTLVECIAAYGLRHFKVKINADAARDRERLARMARIFDASCGGNFAFSLDGNESFHEPAAFVAYARELLARPELRTFWPHLLFIEQPWHRDVALAPALGDVLRAWKDRPPIIIDESDANCGSLPPALERGYAGTSHKNCKGVFKSVINACRLAQRRRAGERVVLSGEDLTNVGPVALTQDLAVAAALGITSIERNGHHYFAGLSQFPAALQAQALQWHPDLFTASADGWPRVEIHDGRLALRTVNAAPCGVAGSPELDALAAAPTG
jgi:hypothetical protein